MDFIEAVLLVMEGKHVKSAVTNTVYHLVREGLSSEGKITDFKSIGRTEALGIWFEVEAPQIEITEHHIHETKQMILVGA